MKNKAAVLVGTTGLLLGALWMLEPTPTSESVREHQRQGQVEQLSDSNDNVNDQHRNHGQDGLDAEQARRSGSHVPDPPERHRIPRVRIRP